MCLDMLGGGLEGTAPAAGAVPTPGRYLKRDEGVGGGVPTGNLAAGSGGPGDKSVRAGHEGSSVVAPLGAEAWGKLVSGVGGGDLDSRRCGAAGL